MAKLIAMLAFIASTIWAFWYSCYGRGYYAIGGEWLLVGAVAFLFMLSFYKK